MPPYCTFSLQQAHRTKACKMILKGHDRNSLNTQNPNLKALPIKPTRTYNLYKWNENRRSPARKPLTPQTKRLATFQDGFWGGSPKQDDETAYRTKKQMHGVREWILLESWEINQQQVVMYYKSWINLVRRPPRNRQKWLTGLRRVNGIVRRLIQTLVGICISWQAHFRRYMKLQNWRPR